jgi:quercetin dioxygenase-like cupin family protein
MKMKKSIALLTLITVLIILQTNAFAQTDKTHSKKIVAKYVELNMATTEYQRILDGDKETVGMYSGLVTLKADSTVGTHNSKVYEEMLIVLEGEGLLIITGGPTIALRNGIAAYIPPQTEHNVKNTGNKPLKYIYVASRTK